MTRNLALAVLAAGVFAPGSASSAVMERMSLDEMSRTADLVVVGTVLSRTSRYDAPPRAHRIVTDVVVHVDDSVRGEAAGEVIVTTPGGEVDGMGQIVTGAPVLRPGEEVVLFLHPARLTPVGPRRAIVGLSQGMFVIHRDRPGAPPRARQRLSGVFFVGHGEGPEAEMDLDLEDLVRAVRSWGPVREPESARPPQTGVRGSRRDIR